MTVAIVTCVLAFALGSVPFGYLIGRAFYRTDIRTQGSGNIGAMNALRTLGKGGAIAVLLLDAAKGFAPPFVTLHVLGSPSWLTALAGAFAVLGHCFSPWLRGKGGKGVATSFGAIFAIDPLAGLCAVAGWFAGALTTRFSSVGSMLANLVAPFALWFFTHDLAYTLYGVFAALFIMYTHRENLGRLRAGNENPITFTRRSSQPHRS